METRDRVCHKVEVGGLVDALSMKAYIKAVGDRVSSRDNYNLVPVFEDPVYQRSEWVAARKV